MDKSEVLKLMIESQRLGYLRCQVDFGIQKTFMSKQLAYDKWDRIAVDRAIAKGEIILIPYGNKYRINRIQAETYFSAFSLN